jgi:large-conductance mechanosensitive channel
MNYKNLFKDGLIILAVLIALIPTTDLIYQLMNTPSDIAFIGPILWFCVMAFSLWFIIQRIKSITNNYKQSEEWKKKTTGKSRKNKENKNN